MRPQDYLLVEGRVRVEIENMASILDRLVACLKRDLQSFLTELATAVGIDSPSC